jgi:hypothetical protein
MKDIPKSEPAPAVTAPDRSINDLYAELLALREKVRHAEAATRTRRRIGRQQKSRR